eukprot:scaffold33329_cov98-Phaeocystis_antarctica.AAC.1
MTVPRWHMTRVPYAGAQVAYATGVICRCPGGICHECHMTVPRWHMPPILCKTCLEASRTRTALA